MKDAASHSLDLPPSASLLGRMGLLCLWMFAVFSAAASALLLLAERRFESVLEPNMTAGLWLRLGLFCGLAALASAVLWRGRATIRQSCAAPDPTLDGDHGASPCMRGGGWLVALVLSAAALLVFPRLDAWPWAAPDEMHHLTVAKNLAFHGEYASGSPELGFKHFDSYDSVGPPVIIPVAAALRCAGLSVVPARMVTGLYFLALLALVHGLCRSLWGRHTALLAMALAPAAFSTLYLARSLYGEIPAMTWTLAGLLLWRGAIASRSSGAAFAAGAALGMAVLCKTIFLLGGFALLAVLVWDALGPRKIGWRAMFFPALGGLMMLGGWSLTQHLAQGAAASTAQDTLGIYRHYLLFGLEPVWGNLCVWLADYPLAHVVSLAALLLVAPPVFSRRYDPAAMTLVLMAAFFGLWWLFFTPGQLPRYYWVGNLVMALFAAPLLAACLREARRTGNWRQRGMACAGALLILASPLHWLSNQGREALLNTEMRDDAALARAVTELPPDTRVAVTFPPLRPTLLFYTGRAVEVLPQNAIPPAEYHCVIRLKTPAFLDVPPPGTRAMGRYTMELRPKVPSGTP